MKPAERLPCGAWVHRPWFKVWFNPILRRLFGLEIATVLISPTMEPVRYVIQRARRWKKLGAPPPDRI